MVLYPPALRKNVDRGPSRTFTWAIICVACAAARHKRSGDKIFDGEEYSSDSESAKNSDSEVSSDMDAIPTPIAED